MNQFCDRLREERERLGLTQAEFASLGGVQKAAQFKYEKGERSPDAGYLMALLPHGVNVRYLLTGEPPSELAVQGLSELQVSVLAAFRDIEPRDQVKAVRILRAMGIRP